MGEAETYLQKAAWAEKLAAETPFIEHRPELLRIAREWRELAAMAGRKAPSEPEES